MARPPRKSALFTDDHRSGTQRQRADEDFFQVYGVHYRIPPLFDEMHAWQPTGGPTYAQCARALRPAPAAGAQPGAGRPHGQAARKERVDASSSSQIGADRSATADLPPDAAAGSEARPDDGARDEVDRWRRSWSVVVRRDILRQQRALVTQQREMLVTQKRSALAVQKEVRKRALRAQRLASNPQVQVRCKRIARDLITLTPAIEAKHNARREAAERTGHELASGMPRRAEVEPKHGSADAPDVLSAASAAAEGAADGETAEGAASDVLGAPLTAAERCILAMMSAASRRATGASADGADERIPSELLPHLLRAVRGAARSRPAPAASGLVGGPGAFAMLAPAPPPAADAAASGAGGAATVGAAEAALHVDALGLVQRMLARETTGAASRMETEARLAMLSELSPASHAAREWAAAVEDGTPDPRAPHRMWSGQPEARSSLLLEAREAALPTGGEHSWRAAFVPRAVSAPPQELPARAP